MRGRILLVDDDEAMRELLVESLERRGYAVSAFDDGQAALDAVDAETEAVLTDLRMPGISGIALTEAMAGRHPDVPVLVMSGFGTVDAAIAAIRGGAWDFLVKPVEIDTLAVALDRAVAHRRLKAELATLRRPARTDGLIGESDAMRALEKLITRVAPSGASVLVHGESGTGKERVAQLLHARSDRSAGPFVALNCAAVPEALLESELFGHVRGAFTDARQGRTGLLVSASGGTLLLDEIGEMPLTLQAKLLRVLQERKVRPVGANEEVPFDVRLVAATHQDLEARVADGSFREDLLYRIDVVRLEVPALRERGSDVLLLAQFFLDQHARKTRRRLAIGPEAARCLLAYAWPGNVRELQNAMERATALAEGEHITLADLPARLRPVRGDAFVVPTDSAEALPTMDEVERRYIVRVLAAVGGQKSLAAKVLGFDRSTLYRKLDKYGLE
ncbi:MAG: sigma-54-dependent Fis family transcriptional regulator [Deltaproteobacteria bacterium]|nr:MAG: sigma-54-dependent Fis family transcriptional regulator [Deltaproteobacteria bacterium]